MAKTEHYYTQFLPDCFYHIYNRTVDKKPMFLSDENRRFFLKRYDKYLSPIVTTYSYALCGNHFHFGIKVKSEEDLTNFEDLSNRNYKTTHELVSHQFKSFFLSYAKAFNKQHNRVGTLFQTPFKRCAVNSEQELIRMIFYHHANPQKHGLCKDFRLYSWTSYVRYLMNRESKLPKSTVFDLIGGRQQFIDDHQNVSLDLSNDAKWIIED